MCYLIRIGIWQKYSGDEISNVQVSEGVRGVKQLFKSILRFFKRKKGQKNLE